MQKIRVAHLNAAYFSSNSYVGGGERYVDYVMQSLQSVGGFDQVLFSLGDDDMFFLRDGIPIRVLRNESSHQGMTNAFSPAMRRELEGFDLVHIHQCLTLFGAYSTTIVKSMRIPAVGTDLGGGEDRQMLQGRGIELLDGVVSISEYAHNLIGSFYTGPHKVLIGPVDTQRFTPRSVEEGNKSLNVICVSRILPHKGIDRIIAALPESLNLTIVGRVYHEPYYELLRNMAQGKKVRFVLDADDDALLDLYNASGVFVQASTARDIYGTDVAKPELMGLTTLEAMSVGLPVIVSDAGSLPELVPDPRFGRIFSNVEDLSRILSEIAEGTWPSPDAGALARAHVIERHGMSSIGHRLADFYKSIIAEKRS